MIEPGTMVRNIFNGQIGEVIDYAGPSTVWVLWDEYHHAKRVGVWRLSEY